MIDFISIYDPDICPIVQEIQELMPTATVIVTASSGSVCVKKVQAYSRRSEVSPDY